MQAASVLFVQDGAANLVPFSLDEFEVIGDLAQARYVHARRDGQCIPLQEDLQAAAQGSPHRMLESKETQVWLRGALAGMNPRWAEVFILRYFDEFDNREIARMLHISRATVAVTLYRVRRLLERGFKVHMRVTR